MLQTGHPRQAVFFSTTMEPSTKTYMLKKTTSVEVVAKPRERIIAAARDLFRKHGIRGVGVDSIAEAAGTNKMTLYRHFNSKDELVATCLREVACGHDAVWKELEARNPGDARAQLSAWIRGGTGCANADRRGCDLANAAVELAETNDLARSVIEEFKTGQRNRLADLCRRAGIADAEVLADALLLLREGASVNSQSVGPDGPWSRATATAEAMIEAFARQAPQGA
jgi:AcrR family transcriptional regulator